MSTKIYDIFPPKEKIISKKSKKTKKRNKKLYFLLLILVIFGIFISYSFLFAFVEINIYPKFEIQNFETEVLVKKDQKELDFEKGIIPGFYLSEEGSLFEEFSSTGKIAKEGKAKGIIRVFNEYSTSPQVFRSGTRFMSASGKVFITPERIVIPGKTLEKGKWVAGFKDVEVVAIEAGEDYNIEPTTFSLPGLSGTALYTFFYGKSFEKMTGGFKKEVAQVTKEDLENAQKLLTEKLKENQIKKLKEKGEEVGGVFFDKSIKQEILKLEPLAKEGNELEKFGYKVEMRSTAFFCKKSFLEKFAKDFAHSITPKEKNILDESINLNWEIKEIDLEKGEVKLILNFSFKVFDNIEEKEIKDKILGKDKKGIEEILKSDKKIERVDIKISPFWINWNKKFIPRDERKIKVQVIVGYKL